MYKGFIFIKALRKVDITVWLIQQDYNWAFWSRKLQSSEIFTYLNVECVHSWPQCKTLPSQGDTISESWSIIRQPSLSRLRKNCPRWLYCSKSEHSASSRLHPNALKIRTKVSRFNLCILSKVQDVQVNLRQSFFWLLPSVQNLREMHTWTWTNWTLTEMSELLVTLHKVRGSEFSARLAIPLHWSTPRI